MASAATTVDYTFEWPAGPKEVVVTGEFDNWKGSLPLLRSSSGAFELTFPVKIPADKDRVFFKFIVDGNWVTSDAYSKGSDANGIENNFISKSEALALSENPVGTKIPEAGGLACATTSFIKEDNEIPEPGSYPKIGGVSKTEEPVSKTVEPVSKTEEPLVKTEEPLVKAEEPLVKTQEPVSKAIEPVSKTVEPVSEDSEASRATSASKKNKNRKKKEKKKAKARAAKAAAGMSASEPTLTTSAPKPEPGAVPVVSETSETDDTEFSTPEPTAIAAVTPEPIKPEVQEPVPEVAKKTSKPKVTEVTTTIEAFGVTTDSPDVIIPKLDAAAIPTVAVETIESEEKPKPTETPAITDAPANVSSAVPEIGSSTTASKEAALEPTQTASSYDSKKRFKIKRRFKKNKITGEKTIVSEERIPLSSEESGSDHPIVDEELIPETGETLKDEAPETQGLSSDVHILPIDATGTADKEYTSIVGGPGPVVPQNASQIKEFSEVRDVDVDELNERLNKEEREKDAAKAKAAAEEAQKEVAQQTLDPKTQQQGLEKQTSNKLHEVGNTESDVSKEEPEIKKVSDKAAVTAVPADAKAQPSKTEKPAPSKTEKKTSVKKSAASAPKQEEKKKKGGFFGKLKRMFQ